MENDVIRPLHPPNLDSSDAQHPNYFAHLHQFLPLGVDKARGAFGRIYELNQVWPRCRRILVLYCNGKYDLFIPVAESLLGAPRPARASEPEVARAQFWEVMHLLGVLLESPAVVPRHNDVRAAVVRVQRRRPKAVREYWEYVRSEHDEQFASIASSVLTRFVDQLGVIRPLLLLRLCDVPPERFGELPKLTSSTFEQCRTLYGEMYEAVGDMSLHLAALNNIRLRGRYSRFERWTLQQFLESDKASRLGPFEAYRPFGSAVSASYDNQIRNASHHGRMRYVVKTGQIEYWPKRGPSRAATALKMAFWEYLERCYDLVQSVGILVSVHHGLEYIHEAPTRSRTRRT